MSVTELACTPFLLGFVTCTNKFHFYLSWHYPSPNNFTSASLNDFSLTSSQFAVGPCSPFGWFSQLFWSKHLFMLLHFQRYAWNWWRWSIGQWFYPTFTWCLTNNQVYCLQIESICHLCQSASWPALPFCSASSLTQTNFTFTSLDILPLQTISLLLLLPFWVQ